MISFTSGDADLLENDNGRGGENELDLRASALWGFLDKTLELIYFRKI